MAKKSAAGSGTLDKADDAPELTDAFFDAATIRDGDKIVRRGRPKLAEPKRLVTIRFPAQTLERLRAMGPGWQGVVVKAVEKELGSVVTTKGHPNGAASGEHRPATPAGRGRRRAAA
jgi:uncharacterized protein (DUF4415 family)